VPEDVTVHQDWLLETVHVELEVTVKVVVPDVYGTGRSEGVTVSVGLTGVNAMSLPSDIPSLLLATNLKCIGVPVTKPVIVAFTATVEVPDPAEVVGVLVP
jgi:hypothetical protein